MKINFPTNVYDYSLRNRGIIYFFFFWHFCHYIFNFWRNTVYPNNSLHIDKLIYYFPQNISHQYFSSKRDPSNNISLDEKNYREQQDFPLNGGEKWLCYYITTTRVRPTFRFQLYNWQICEISLPMRDISPFIKRRASLLIFFLSRRKSK